MYFGQLMGSSPFSCTALFHFVRPVNRSESLFRGYFFFFDAVGRDVDFKLRWTEADTKNPRVTTCIVLFWREGKIAKKKKNSVEFHVKLKPQVSLS